MDLSPADDVLIRVERALDLDSDAQLVASVLSKKISAGATRVVIDVPVGPTAKLRTDAAAASLSDRLLDVGARLELPLAVELTDGSQPVGRGIGPALEARDVLAVLRGDAAAPADLRERAGRLAGRLLEFGGLEAAGEGHARGLDVLDSGAAWRKFQAICEAQGGMREPPVAAHVHDVESQSAGAVSAIDNRRLAKAAKLAGAPNGPAAGIEMRVRLGERVGKGEPLYRVHAETPGELAYALNYIDSQADIISIEEALA